MNGYLVLVEGDYFGTATEYDRKREKYPYSVTVKVPRPEGALSLIKNKLLDKVLRRNYPNYHAWRTHQLVSITNLDGSKVHGLSDPRLMDFNDLAAYVRKHKLPLKLEFYTDLGFLRKMVYLAETNQHEFHIKQGNLEREYREELELKRLNPEIYSSQGSKGSDVKDKTTIIEGKVSIPKPSEAGNMFTEYVSENPPSLLTSESKPKTQKVEKVFVKGKGFVNADNFEEDFNKPEEKEFEVFDPYNVEVATGSEDNGTTTGTMEDL